MSKQEMYKCKSIVDDDGGIQDCTCGQCGYFVNVKKWKRAYEDVLKTCNKYPDFYNKYGFSDIQDMSVSAKNHLVLIEWFEKYKLKISHDCKPYSNNYLSVNNYMVFSQFKDAIKDKEKGSGKFISWSDDGRQPEDEWLLNIRFFTGAYIFGEDYDSQKQLFQDFVDELKSYKPDYSDTVNKSFYWKLESAKPVFDEFSSILKKYQERNQSELKKRKAEKLRKELKALEEQL